VWLVLAGRGWGKTRAGGELVRRWVRAGDTLVNLIGATADDARDVMVLGESGILALCPPDERPTYKKAERRLDWPNGAQSLIFTADEPDRLRGKQHQKLWCDEPAAWRYSEDAWAQAMLGLRLGTNPQVVATTTPRPIALLRTLLADPHTVVTRGSTYENRANLASAFYEQIIRRYEGTRLGRQELLAELLEDQPGALWQRAALDRHRVVRHPELVRIVVGVDPEATSTEGSAETGIVVAALGVDGHGYVLDDASLRGSPQRWASEAVAAYHRHHANLLVAETNQGGEMVEATIRSVDERVPYRGVRASHGKQARAEPISSRYERGEAHHVGTFAALEDQLCLAAGTRISTWRGRIPVESVGVGDLVLTRAGWRPVLRAGPTGVRRTIRITTTLGTLCATPHHPLFVLGRGFVPAIEAHTQDTIIGCPFRSCAHLWPLVASGTSSTTRAITAPAGAVAVDSCTATSTRRAMARSPLAGRSITGTGIGATTPPRTWWRSHARLTCVRTSETGSSRPRAVRAAPHNTGPTGSASRRTRSPASSAGWSLLRPAPAPPSVAVPVVTGTIIGIIPTGIAEPVYNLTVAGPPEYFANGILVHNCGWVPGSGPSPDRLDALVWALTELFAGGTTRFF
jgi:phage terminase large subunit-like protein